MERDIKIVIPNLFDTRAGHPDTEIEYLVLLKNKTQSLGSIEHHGKTNLPSGVSHLNFIQLRRRTVRWNFGDGWAAPAIQPVALSDYPAFQLLPLEVQDALLHHFSERARFEERHIPKETSLLPNYPNPFNPETWIPYQLAVPADVRIAIYAVDGQLVRTLDLGHQPVGVYKSQSRAAYWDGRNSLGEPVASGVYFYTLTAGEFTATRKMLIRK